jgi:hypothetical protein
MALSNSERQRLFRERRDIFYRAMERGPDSAIEAILWVLGRDNARLLCDELDKALRRPPEALPWATPTAHDAKGISGSDDDLVTQALTTGPLPPGIRLSPALKRRLARKALRKIDRRGQRLHRRRPSLDVD